MKRMKSPKTENKKNNRKMSMQKMCVMYAVLPGNHLKTKETILSGLGAQEKPANVKVLIPVKMSATGGCITDVETFTT